MRLSVPLCPWSFSDPPLSPRRRSSSTPSTHTPPPSSPPAKTSSRPSRPPSLSSLANSCVTSTTSTNPSGSRRKKRSRTERKKRSRRGRRRGLKGRWSKGEGSALGRMSRGGWREPRWSRWVRSPPLRACVPHPTHLFYSPTRHALPAPCQRCAAESLDEDLKTVPSAPLESHGSSIDCPFPLHLHTMRHRYSAPDFDSRPPASSSTAPQLHHTCRSRRIPAHYPPLCILRPCGALSLSGLSMSPELPATFSSSPLILPSRLHKCP